MIGRNEGDLAGLGRIPAPFRTNVLDVLLVVDYVLSDTRTFSDTKVEPLPSKSKHRLGV